ncbi:MAG: LPS assembly protein LptD [Pseudomonadota bacterium]
MIKLSKLLPISVFFVGLLIHLPLIAMPSAAQLFLSKQLGWIIDKQDGGICNGYYEDLPIPYIPDPDLKDQSHTYNIRANSSRWSLVGDSEFKGDVRMTKENQEITADRATVHRDPNTNKIVSVQAEGNVHFHQPGIAVVSDWAELKEGLMTLKNALYRVELGVSTNPNQSSQTVADPHEIHRIYNLTAHGKAKEMKQVAPHIYNLTHATYTTCPPTGDTWQLSGTHVKLNFPEGRGTATNMVLRIKKVPIFYLPYYSFPINRWRKTGFLFPYYHYSTIDGWHVYVPFYWNMAPNYDFEYVPEWISQRGLKNNGIFNYLTKYSRGRIYGSFLPHDRLFRKNRRSFINTYSGNPAFADRFNTLLNTSNNRKAISWFDQTTFNSHWQGNVNFNYAGDNYYDEDFPQRFNTNTTVVNNQLLQQANLKYTSQYWNMTDTVQRYQTLHPIDAGNVQNQYEKLPFIGINVNPLSLYQDTTFSMQSQYTNFKIRPQPDSTKRFVVGQRFYAKPDLSLQFTRPYGSLTSEAKLWSVQYLTPSRPNNYGPRQIGRAIPIFDTLGKINFIRNMALFKNKQQTLEPEFYYLYVPYVNQQTLPIFDAGNTTFSYAQMFSDNDFSGYDRLSNNNRLTLGLKSSVLDGNTGTQKAIVSVAEAYYFSNRRVCVGYDCSNTTPANQQINTQKFSPVAVSGGFTPSSKLRLQERLTWDPYTKKIGSQYSNFQFRAQKNRIINLSYYDVVENQISGFVPTLDTNTSNLNNMRESQISSVWRLNDHIEALGSWNHNWSNLIVNRSNNTTKTDVYNTYTYGLQYNSCCWAARVVAYRGFRGFDTNFNPKLDSGVYFQIALNGLGSLGNNNGLSSILSQNIAGYQNDFGRGIN